ncbi:hypothetical protein N7495_000299 [Penicillium taxi]|uniref:uncharacterized protein n=1 Tax=Penicillium taxi TaxID=168475 RepID=UPI002544DD16|nr:uncharacterized protein N7495_000299 [Penicillium taxi]KAJ5907617.1 hypothetical protein N7495_000299 [Penicillium taxi]
MDPLSIIAGTIGIAGTAVHSINTLIHDINAVKDAPEVIADLKNDLLAMDAIMKSLESSEMKNELKNLSPQANMALQLAIKNCQKACDKFGVKLTQWTKHSDEKMQWWDRVRVGLFAEATVESLNKQLGRNKSSIIAAVGTAVLISTATQSELRTKEINIAKDIIEVDNQKAFTQKALQKFTELELREDSHQNRTQAIEQLEDQLAELDDSRRLLEELLSKTHEVHTGLTISKIDMSDGGKLLVGLINYDQAHGDIHLDVHDVKATNNGKGVVGAIKGLDVNAFFNS